MERENSTKSKIFTSLFWKLMERGGTQGVQFIVQIVLARLLSPDDFGTVAIVMVVIQLAQVFVQSGFNTALIQKKDADELDFSSVFYLSLFVAILVYILTFFTAPYIANFYGDPLLTSVLRVLTLTLFFGAFNSIQNSYIARNMLFKKLFFSSLGAMIFSGLIGIFAAFMGLGVWALVIQQLINQSLITVILWFTLKWRPCFIFSFKRIKVLFSFGSSLLASSLLNVLYMNIRTLIIGRTYSSSMLGYYDRGEQFPKVVVSNIDGSIQSVMLPTLSAYQDNRKRLKEMVRRSILISSFIIFPMMTGLAVVAESLIKLVLTDKWLSSVPFMQIFCISYALMPIQTANLQAITAVGRSDIFLKLEITKKTIGIIILVVSIPFGIYAIAYGLVLNSIISSFINAYPNKQLLNYSYNEQWRDIMPSLFISLVMGAIVHAIKILNLVTWQLLIIQIIVGIIVYIALITLFKIESFGYLVSIIHHTIKSKKGVSA